MRNASRVGHREVDIPHSHAKLALAQALARDGFLEDVRVIEGAPRAKIRVRLRYSQRGEPVFGQIRRVSVPGRRQYRKIDDLPRTRGGAGSAVLSTSKGVLTEREARQQRVGGEVLCQIW